MTAQDLQNYSFEQWNHKWTKNHLNPETTKLKQEQERTTCAGDPPTDRLRADWRERMEDMVWAPVYSPEFVFVP